MENHLRHLKNKSLLIVVALLLFASINTYAGENKG